MHADAANLSESALKADGGEASLSTRSLSNGICYDKTQRGIIIRLFPAAAVCPPCRPVATSRGSRGGGIAERLSDNFPAISKHDRTPPSEVLSGDPPRFTVHGVQPQPGLALNSEQLLFTPRNPFVSCVCECVCVRARVCPSTSPLSKSNSEKKDRFEVPLRDFSLHPTTVVNGLSFALHKGLGNGVWKIPAESLSFCLSRNNVSTNSA